MRIWKAPEGALCTKLVAHGSWVKSVVYSSDGQLLASCSKDQTVCVWDPNGDLKFRLHHDDSVELVVWSPVLARLCSVTRNGMIRVWDAEQGALVRRFGRQDERVTSVVWSSEGSQLLVATRRSLAFWEVDSGQAVLPLNVNGIVHSLSRSWAGRAYAIGDDQGDVRCFAAETLAPLALLETRSGRITCLCFSGDGRKIVAKAENGSVFLWNWGSAGEPHVIKASSCRACLGALAVHPWENRLALVRGNARNVELWEYGTARPKPKKALQRSAVYISYAWNDEGTIGAGREDIVNRLFESLQAAGYDVRRDKMNLGYRGLISEFMKELGAGDCIIVVISDKYLRSPFCMYELLQIDRNAEFRERICPVVLPDARIHTLADRLEYASFWKHEHERLRMAVESVGVEVLSLEGSLKEYEKYRDITHNLDRLVTLLADINTLTPVMLAADNFEILRLAIDQRLAAIGMAAFR